MNYGLGFGLMRLPQKDGVIDIDMVKQMVDRFLDAGFTYFDTAFIYDGSEEAIREALVRRYPRDSFRLATKLAAWAGMNTAEEAKQEFFISLDRTGAGYFDYYLLHNLGGSRSEIFEKWGLWDFLLEQKREGRIRHLGFSFHDTAPVLDEILARHPEAEYVQLQVNYADWNDGYVQSRACYETAKKYGKPVIIMEPVKGGILADPPKPVADILTAAKPDATLASWALRFAASLDNNLVVLSGMSNMEQLEDNIQTMTRFRALDAAEQAVIVQAQDALASFPTIPCTGCGYCMAGCPQNIRIPSIFGAMNRYTLYGDLPQAKVDYEFYTRGYGSAEDCIACGRCEAVCPQHIPVITHLAEARELFR